MPLNPNIILGAQRPQIMRPQDMAQAAAAMQQNELANRMGQMKMQEYERGIQENNALAGVYRSAVGPDGKLDRNKLYSGAAGAGLGAKIPGLQKEFAGQDKDAADTSSKNFETASKRLDVMGQALGWLRKNPSPENAQQVLSHLASNGVMDEKQLGMAIQQLQANPTPEGIAQFAELGFQASLKSKDQLATYQTRNTGGTTDTLAIDPVTGKVAVVNSVQNTQSPDNKASVGASYANAAATRAVAASNVEAAKIKGDRDTEMKIADDYRAQSKTFKEVSDAYKTINATLDKATTSAAATLAGATKFMKLLDPGSVVRESELGMALAATGALDRATNYFNTLKFGNVLTKAQAEDFKNITAQIYAAAQSQQKAIDQNYTQQAKTYGLRPEMIVQDLGQNAPSTSNPAAPAAGVLPGGWKVQAR